MVFPVLTVGMVNTGEPNVAYCNAKNAVISVQLQPEQYFITRENQYDYGLKLFGI